MTRRDSWRIGAFALLLPLAMLASAAPAWAQALPGIKFSSQARAEQIGPNHYRLTGNVEGELERENLKFAADQVDYYTDTRRLIGSGHVVVITKDSHISADKADIDTRTRTGVFYNAFGTVTVTEEQGSRSMFGTQEPIAYFYGERIERLSADKYKITKGGFTTCVQPTPRWEAVTSTTTMRVDKYALLKNAVLKVKNVPLMYLPAMYYPIQKDDRATGFLMPVYGNTTLHGQSVSNAFFWAINRSQDMTLVHDWLPSSGQGYGTEYRYIRGPGADGNFRFYRLSESATGARPERQSFEVRANAIQRLPAGLSAKANVDYFSDVTVQQSYQMDFYNATLRNRTYGGNLAGAWGRNNASFTYDQNEVFYGTENSLTVGARPRISYRLSPTPIIGNSLFFTASSEYAALSRIEKYGDQKTDYSLSRYDVTPAIQFPFTALPFLTVRSSLEWHNTYYTESYVRDPRTNRQVQTDDPLHRKYFMMQSRILGPVFSKVWNTPENGYADRYKHLVEPEVTISRTTMFDNDNIIKLEGYDYTYGGTTRVTYGLTNRFLAKRRTGGTSASGAPTTRTQEFLNIAVQQSYYTNPNASQYDGNYSGGFIGRPPSNYSPVALVVRASPSERFNSTLRMEYSTQEDEFETISADGQVQISSWLTTGGNYSQRKYFDAYDPRQSFTNFLGSRTVVRIKDGRVGGYYDFQMNAVEGDLVQQRIGLSYNAQCCGIAFEYQAFNFPDNVAFAVPQDRRFSVSFTLAGIGTFSNFLGAFGIGQGANSTYGGRY
jgi:lipopolysaccharide assembly outer membrane protein LptD (OstA)